MVFVTFSSLYSFVGDDLSSFNIPYADKLVHFTFYFVGLILGSLYVLQLKDGQQVILRKIVILAFILVLFGIIIEVIQGKLTVNRSGEVFDALANTTGVIMGFIVIFNRFYKQRGLK